MKKKLIALTLMLIAIISLTACTNTTTQPAGGSSETSSSEISSSATIKQGKEIEIDYEVESQEEEAYDGTPTDLSGKRQAGKQDATYTYNIATNSLPTEWNIHTYQSNSGTMVLDYTEDSLYGFDYNATMDGFKIVTGMAKSMPQDVTAEYVGQWGIEAGEKGKAYKIELRDDLKWQDGRAITADDFVESIKLLINPTASNYRADSVWSGNLKIVGAKGYFEGGKTLLYDCTEGEGLGYGEELFLTEGTYTLDGGKFDTFTFITVDPETEESTYDLDAFRAAIAVSPAVQSAIKFDLTNSYVGAWVTEKYGSYVSSNGAAWVVSKIGGPDLSGLVGKTLAEVLADDDMTEALIAACYEFWCTDPGEEFGFFCYEESNEVQPWSSVGFTASEDKKSLIIFLEDELTGFYLRYSLCTSFYLVDTALYQSCISESQDVYSCSYGTSVATYTSFGPYKLTEFIDGNKLAFEKNTNWYGYSLPENSTCYWTTNIEILQVSEDETRRNMFLAGQLDSYGLQAADMADYQSSDYTYYTDGDSTWFVAINPNKAQYETAQAAAEPVNAGNKVFKTVLLEKEFRQALSFSIDRAAYALALDPLGGTAKALYGNMIISDPDNGTAYRTTNEAKEVIVKFWGLYEEIKEYGFADGLYDTVDEAIESITGYDLAGPKTLFGVAYANWYAKQSEEDKAAIDGGNWEIQIMIGQPGSGSNAYYTNGYTLLKQVWTDAVVGTPFEGHLTFKQSQPLGSSSFSNYLKNGSVDVLFGVGWTGSTLDPYGLMEAYVDPRYQYDPGWDTTSVQLAIEFKAGELCEEAIVLSASVYDWGKACLGGNEIKAFVVVDGEVTSDYAYIAAGTLTKPSVRLTILAAVEGIVLEQYDMMPINLDASANMRGMQIIYGTEEYVFGMGRGGIRYMTYKYTDAEWATFVAENAVDGVLGYKKSTASQGE